MFDKFVQSKTCENLAIVHKMNEVVKPPEKISDKETKMSLPKEDFKVGDTVYFAVGTGGLSSVKPLGVETGKIESLYSSGYKYVMVTDNGTTVFRQEAFASIEETQQYILKWCEEQIVFIEERIEEYQSAQRKLDHKLYLFLQSIKETENATGSEVSQES